MQSVISLDIESTGLSIYRDEMTQIAVALERFNPDTGDRTRKREHFFKSFVKATCKFDPEAVKITGISADTVKNAPPFMRVMDSLARHLDAVIPDGDIRVLVTHNGNCFDIPFLVSQMCRVTKSADKVNEYFRALRITYLVDTLPMSRGVVDPICLPRNARGTAPSHKLGDVHEGVVGHRFDNAHDALADCVAVLDILGTKVFTNVLCDDTKCVQWMTSPMTIISSCVKRYQDAVDKAKNKKNEGRLLSTLISGAKKKR
jgi:DNA polymerase III epsilon subunit-like protein